MMPIGIRRGEMKLTHNSRRWVVPLVALAVLTGASGGLSAQESSSERLLVLLRDASALALSLIHI